MNSTGKSLFYFGIYETTAGLLYLLAPALGIKLLMIEVDPASLDWIRVAGLLVCGFGYYYLRLGLVNDFHYAQVSVHFRYFLAAAFPVLALSTDLPDPLIAFGLIDLVGAYFTQRALKRDLG